MLESDATVTRPARVGGDSLHAARSRRTSSWCSTNSSFDARAIPGVTVPAGYGAHFKSDDGKQRSFMVEGAGGPSWYTEYNVLTGLSVRSYGRFADFVTRIAAGRVERGLPQALRRCGYKTFTPLSDVWCVPQRAAASRRPTGIQSFLDSEALGANFLDPDSFYFDKAARHDREGARQGPAVPAGLYGAEPLSRGTSASVPISRPNGAIPATAPMSTNICGAST